MKTFIIYALFIAAVLTAGILTGVSNLPGPWYDSLQKPFFQPPPWIFSPVWTVLYVMIAVAGARTWLRAPASGRMQVWFVQMVLNLLWSPAFFGMQSPGFGLTIIIPLLAFILAFIAMSRAKDPVSAWLFAPYALWTAFASVLNASIFLLN